MDDKRPSHTPRKVQDPSRVYERCRPEDECGQGRLENNSGTPTDTPDRIDQAVKNRQPNRQINADDVVNEREEPPPLPARQPQPDHSMLEEEPDGWDLAPNDIHNPRHKRHPRTEGRGGTP